MRLPARARATLLLLALVSPIALAAQTPASPPAGSLAHVLLDQLAAVRDSSTLDGWMARHPGDSIIRFTPLNDPGNRGAWCALAGADLPLPAGDTAGRSVYFYPPAPRNSRTLPPDDSAATLYRQCRAGMAWTYVVDLDVPRNESLKDSTELDLTTALGPGDLSARVAWLQTRSWLRTSYRRAATSAAALALAIQHDTRTQDGLPYVFANRIVAVATSDRAARNLPQMPPAAPPDTTPRPKPIDSLRARGDTAFTIAAIGGSIGAALAALRAKLDSTHNACTRDSIAPTLRRWLTTADSLTPTRRAAALFVADETVREADVGTGCEGKLQLALAHELGDAGARFVIDTMPLAIIGRDDRAHFEHNWMQEAARIAPPGKMRDMAYLTVAPSGMTLVRQCANGARYDGFRDLIASGEAFLRDNPRTTIALDVHLMLADAWSDITVLAAGGGSQWHHYDSVLAARYQGESSTARAKTVAHLRAALALMPDGAERDARWMMGWGLLAGYPPGVTTYYCEPD